MAALPQSFIMQSHCVNCGALETSKLIAVTHCDYGKWLIHSSRKMNVERNMVCGEVAKCRTRNLYQNHRLKVLATSRISVVKTAKKVSTYLFRTEIGGHVKVIVEKENNKYGVYVQVSSLRGMEDDLVMSWGLFRSDSSCLMSMNFQNSGLDGKSSTVETPFVQKYVGGLEVVLDFEASLAPFYFSFLLKSLSDCESKSSEIRSHRETNFVVPVGFSSGHPSPLGLSFLDDGSMNFAIFSRSAEGVVLCLYDKTTIDKPTLEIDLDPYVNRSGDIWHASMDYAMPFVSYGYRFKGGASGKGDKLHGDRVLLDPYAKIVGNCLGQLHKEPTFDWGNDVHPCLPMEKLVVYRLNVMRFTKDKSSKLSNDIAGTFSGITEKLSHFKDLGVNAILLEPIFTFDEKKGPYFPSNFFSPSNLYGYSGGPMSVINSVKEMVRSLHANGIEVFLEVVFTITAEGAALEEIDNYSYYVKGGDSLGTRNALNCNYPIVQQMILDSLRHWVIEFHIDGFCFINASSLLRGFHGEYLSRPPLVEAITFDPLLSKVKIISDSWDPHDIKPKEIRFPHWKRWAEVNTKFCNDVRIFLRGEGLLSNLATRLCGSEDIFLDGRGPAFSFNFIARNSGLPLVDLVSFSSSVLASQLSWNCGEEGPTNKTVVLERRLKQIRNFLFILFVSLGVPILNMGDECGQSSGGTGDRKSLDWNALKTVFGIQITQFISFLSSLRMRRSDLFQKRNFLKEENIDWYGSDRSPPRWDDPSRKFIAMTLKTKTEDSQTSSESSQSDSDLFLAFNAAELSESVILPPLTEEMVWVRLVDTALPFPGFFSVDGEPLIEQMAGLFTYKMKSHSCVLFEARSLSTGLDTSNHDLKI